MSKSSKRTLDFAMADGLAVSSLVESEATHPILGLPSKPNIVGTTESDELYGTGKDDWIVGKDGNDGIAGRDGNDLIEGGGDSDYIWGDSGADQLFGGDGNDRLDGYTGADELDGGDGIDIAHYDGSETGVTVSLANSSLNTGIAAGDTFRSIEGLVGSYGTDVLIGNNQSNFLWGDKGNDALRGNSGGDTIWGGGGRDVLTGGADGDTFAYRLAGESTVALNDLIVDFTSGSDEIDVFALDAKMGVAGNQAFKFIGQGEFTNHAGELRFQKDDNAGTANDFTIVQADRNGDGRADFQITLKGLVNLASGDFEL